MPEGKLTVTDAFVIVFVGASEFSWSVSHRSLINFSESESSTLFGKASAASVDDKSLSCSLLCPEISVIETSASFGIVGGSLLSIMGT